LINRKIKKIRKTEDTVSPAAAGREREFKVPSSKLWQIHALLNTPVRIQLQGGDNEIEL
jgi:hypothetical protein